MKKLHLLLLTLTALGTGALFAAEAPKVGAAAPGFSLPDSDGKTHSLGDFKGKYVVLEWFNPGCPFVKKHYTSENMQQLQKEFTGKEVVWLTIDSSAEGKEGYLTPEADANKQMTDWKMKPTALLLDPDGKVGHDYNATNTPHMYVINPEGKLIYSGAIDRQTDRQSEGRGRRDQLRESGSDEAMAGKPVANFDDPRLRLLDQIRALSLLRAPATGETEERAGRQPNERHPELHQRARDDNRPVTLNPAQAGGDDFLDRDISQSGPGNGAATIALRDLGELRPDRPRAKRGDANARLPQFAPQRLGETRHVSLRRGVDRKIRNRQETGRGADVQNCAALLRNHAGQQAARQPGQRHHVDQHHLVEALLIRARESAEIAQSGVVDQQIDRRFLRCRPGDQFVDRGVLREIGRADLDSQLRISPEQFRAQFFQPIAASRDENEGGRAVAQLAGKLAPDASRSARDQRMTTFQPHHDPPLVRSGSSTRQTLSARMRWPAAVG